MPRMTRILYVEDEADLREVLVEDFEEEGFEMVSASNGKEALGKLESFRADLVITGWLMPVMTGIQLIREMRREGSGFTATPVILVSAYTSRAHIEEALSIGACRFVTKPVDFIALLKSVRELCRPGGNALGECSCDPAVPATAIGD